MTFAVTVLGSSGMWATVERACAGYLYECGGATLWVDAGAGTWRQLQQLADYRALDGIVLTHRHPDHTSDVFQALHARELGAANPLPPIPLWAPEQAIDRLVGFSSEMEKAFDLRVVSDGTSIEVGDARLSFVAMAHPPDTLGIRTQCDGRVLAYSSDTGPSADFERLLAGADVFVCEATFQDSDPEWEGHLRASQAGAIAAKYEVARLVLTHLPPDKDHAVSLAEAQDAAGDIDVMLASDGLRLEIG